MQCNADLFVVKLLATLSMAFIDFIFYSTFASSNLDLLKIETSRIALTRIFSQHGQTRNVSEMVTLKQPQQSYIAVFLLKKSGQTKERDHGMIHCCQTMEQMALWLSFGDLTRWRAVSMMCILHSYSSRGGEGSSYTVAWGKSIYKWPKLYWRQAN